MRSARVLEGDSRTTIPSSGRTSRERGVDGRGVERVGGRDFLRARVRLRRRARGLGHRLEQRLQGQPDVGDDRVAHRRPRRLVGVAGDRDQLRALGQQRAGDVRVVGEDRAADDEDQVVALERLADRADRRRQDAAEVGVALGEAEAAAAGRRRWPRPAGAGARRGRSPASQPPLASMSGPATRTGLAAASRRSARARTASGSATARPVTLRPIACAGVGLVDLGVPVVHRHRDEDGALRRQRRRGGRRGRGPAARPRPAAARRTT